MGADFSAGDEVACGRLEWVQLASISVAEYITSWERLRMVLAMADAVLMMFDTVGIFYAIGQALLGTETSIVRITCLLDSELEGFSGFLA